MMCGLDVYKRQTLSSGNLRFFVTYDDSEETDPYATGVESAYFYFDGTYRGTYDRDNLGSTSGLMHFGSGLHSITFYLKDGYGNVTRETRYFTVAAEETDVPGVSLDLRGEPTVGKMCIRDSHRRHPHRSGRVGLHSRGRSRPLAPCPDRHQHQRRPELDQRLYQLQQRRWV